MNLTSYRKRSGYGQRVKWSKNAVAAKARKRIERGDADLPDEPDFVPFKGKPVARASVSIRIGRESISFQVLRYDEKRMLCRGKVQAASSIGKRIALVLENLL